MKSAKSIKLDRGAFSIVSVEEAQRESKTYWRDKSPHERLEALEITRQVLYGYDPATLRLSAFLRLLIDHEVEYLLIGGYAVGYHGYVRATADLDIWVPRDEQNSRRLVTALREFGFTVPELEAEVFLVEDRIVRMGVPPVQIEIATTIAGVEFAECYAERVEATWDDVTVNVISLARLRENKKASGRHQDLSDLSHLDSLD